MKKNSHYVGVDEKYIPEDEKYVDESLLGGTDEIRDGVSEGIKKIRGYVTDKDNQEKFKTFGRKGLKIAKGIGIGYIAFFGIIIFMFLLTFIVFIVNMFKINSRKDDIYDNAKDQIDGIYEQMNQYTDSDIRWFNSSFETYSGTKSLFMVSSLLDKIVTNNKTERDHIITVVYGDTNTTDPKEIVSIKHSLNDDKKYEVYLDYDSNGFVNMVTLTEL